MSERDRALSEVEQKELTYLLDKMLLEGFTAREREIARTVAELVFQHTAKWPRAALPVVGDAPRCEWREIATAPKDGTIIDVWLGDASDEDLEFYCAPGTRRSAGWHFRQGRFRPYMGLGLPVVTVRPTHWRPLPAPPVPLVLRPAEESQS